MIGKMLVAFDASAESYKAFDFALEMAAMSKPVPGILVLSVSHVPEDRLMVEADAIVNATTKEFGALLKELEEKAEKKNLKVSTEVAFGHPVDKIVEFARKKDCQLIIMGHKGRSKLESMVLGSVSKGVVTEAPCTVIIVR